MAYNSANLSQTGQTIGGEYRRFTYLTLDAYSTVAASGYFDGETRLEPGDRIAVVVVDDLTRGSRATGEAYELVVASI